LKQQGNKILPRNRAKLPPSKLMDRFAGAERCVYEDDQAPVLSVVMPFFRAGWIGWLPLESLTRQQNVDFPWELIIIEENFENPLGWAGIMAYKKQLIKAGCVKILYIELKKWIPLSAKWFFMIRECSPSSSVVCFGGADVYFGAERLRKQYDVLTDGKHNWYKLAGNVVYDISLGKHVKKIGFQKERGDTACRACTKQLAECLPLVPLKRGVDGWMYNTLQAQGMVAFYDQGDMWKDTINVNGLNNISFGRHNRIKLVTPPLELCCNKLTNHIPEEVVKKLESAKSRVRKHKRLIKQSKVRVR